MLSLLARRVLGGGTSQSVVKGLLGIVISSTKLEASLGCAVLCNAVLPPGRALQKLTREFVTPNLVREEGRGQVLH